MYRVLAYHSAILKAHEGYFDAVMKQGALDRKLKEKVAFNRWAGRGVAGDFKWNEVAEIGAVVAGRIPGRPDNQAITLFKSIRVAMEDVAIASIVYERALQEGVGLEVPLTED